jgi:hypothetical protein
MNVLADLVLMAPRPPLPGFRIPVGLLAEATL